MTYKELLSSVQCKCIVLFEDDFTQGDYRKEQVMYDLSRMDLDDRTIFLKSIKGISEELLLQLENYFDVLDKYFSSINDWEEKVPQGDICPAFLVIGNDYPTVAVTLRTAYDAIDEALLVKVYPLGARFGIGMNLPNYFENLFYDYLRYDGRYKSLRIYNDFSAGTEKDFRDDLNLAGNTQSIVCIVDNHLKGTNRAKEIIEFIRNASPGDRKNVIGSILSSKEQLEEIDDAIYFEFTAKGEPETLKAAIARSAYNFFISKLKTEVISNLDHSFSAAVKNKGIAAFLSNKALAEGMSEYDIIKEWIKLMCLLPKEENSTMKQLVSLSKVINGLELEDYFPDPALEKLNTLEAFDFTPNDYFLPTMPGDVFVNSKGEWFVLIGQDCDMTRSISRSPKNALTELLPAKIRKQTSFDKWANDLKTASIYNFRSSMDAESEVLQVDYQKREYIANEVISLCSFNSNGSCSISLDEDINFFDKRLMSDCMVDYYKSLQRYFRAVKNLKETAADDFDSVIAQEFSPRLISVTNYDLQNDVLTFDLHRVCRLTHSYVFYLYKLYLEYRGRQPFQTINLIRSEDVSLPIKYNNQLTEIHVSIRCVPIPNKRNRKDWCWILDKSELDLIMKGQNADSTINIRDNDIILDKESIEIPLNGAHKLLKITKLKDKMDMNIQ